MKWPLHDHYDVEVWTSGNALVATLPGRLIRHLVELHLAGAALQTEVRELVRPTLAKVPARAILAREQRDQLRAKRRSRRKTMKSLILALLLVASPAIASTLYVTDDNLFLWPDGVVVGAVGDPYRVGDNYQVPIGPVSVSSGTVAIGDFTLASPLITEPDGLYVCPAGEVCSINGFGLSVIVFHNVGATPGTGPITIGTDPPVVGVPEPHTHLLTLAFLVTCATLIGVRAVRGTWSIE